MPPNTHRSPLPQGEGAIGSSAAGVHGPSPQPSPAGRGCQIGSATAALTAPGLRKQPTYPRKPPPSKPSGLPSLADRHYWRNSYNGLASSLGGIVYNHLRRIHQTGDMGG